MSKNAFSQFETYAKEHLAELEALRRVAYSNYLKRLLAAIVLILIVISCSAVAAYLEKISLFAASVAVVLAFVGASFFVVQSILDYRRRNWKLLGSHSLKETVFNKLFGYFGDFRFSNLTDVEDLTTKGVSPAQFRHAPHIPEYHVYRAEDYITGNYHDAKIEMSEAEMIWQEAGKQICIFRGLIVVIDMSEVRLKLRGEFAGKGVVIADAKKVEGYAEKRYADYTHYALPQEYEGAFEAYTTNIATAKEVFTPDFLAHLQKLQELVSGLQQQVTHKDEQLFWLRAQASNVALELFEKTFLGVYFIGRVLWGFFERVNYIELMRRGVNLWGIWSRDRHPNALNYEHIADSDKFADTVSYAFSTLNTSVECSFYADKLLITLPHTHDLFEPNALFEPALNHEDLKLVYELMHTVQAITSHICEAKDSENKRARSYD